MKFKGKTNKRRTKKSLYSEHKCLFYLPQSPNSLSQKQPLRPVVCVLRKKHTSNTCMFYINMLGLGIHYSIAI